MTFKPKQKTKTKRHIGVDFPPDKYAKISAAAKKSNLSIKEYCRQAISYVMGWES